MKMKLTTITPTLAVEMLKRNTQNRSLSPRTIDRYSADMVAGRWKMNGDTIRIAPDGTIVDGQHRLASVVKSNIPLQTWIAEDVPFEVFDTIDTGKLRNGADMFSIQGIKNASAIAAALRTINYAVLKRKVTTTNIMLEELLAKYPDVKTSVHLYKNKIRPIVAPGTACGLHCLFSRIDQFAAKEFFDSLVDGTGFEKNDPIKLLRDFLIGNKTAYKKISAYDVTKLIMRTWNYKITGKTVRILQPPPDVPDIETKPQSH